MRRRRFWWAQLTVIIAAGILSRFMHTGLPLIDKYPGDALYAAMVYVLFRLTCRTAHVALWAAATMTAIEVFQLTGIPATLFHSHYAIVRLCARLIGTEFSMWDLAAYAVGIASIAAIDYFRPAANAT